MSEPDLNKYSDREIVAALFKLSANKFLVVMNSINAIAQRIEKRGKLIAQENSDEVVEKMLRDLFEEDKK